MRNLHLLTLLFALTSGNVLSADKHDHDNKKGDGHGHKEAGHKDGEKNKHDDHGHKKAGKKKHDDHAEDGDNNSHSHGTAK